MVKARGDGANAGSRERIVIKLSGSIFSQEKQTKLRGIASLLSELGADLQPVAIAGGGKIARHYIESAREFGLDEASLDILGIEVSRLNAKLLCAAIEGIDGASREVVYHSIPKDLEEVSAAAASGKIVVTGGLHPGQSTNATAALIAEKVGASRFLNATDVEGIYDSDPRKNAKAKMFRSITVAECMRLLGSESASAGSYDLMDIVALKVIERSKIPTIVLKSEVATIRKAARNNADVGTRITSR